MEIRQEQIDAFEPQTDDEIITFIIEHLEDESPELIDRIPNDGLREMVGNGVKRARGHNLKSLANLTAFVSLMFEIAPNFDEQTEIDRVLSDENAPIEENFDRLFEPELDDDWERAADSYDAESWAEAWYPELKDEEN